MYIHLNGKDMTELDEEIREINENNTETENIEDNEEENKNESETTDEQPNDTEEEWEYIFYSFRSDRYTIHGICRPAKVGTDSGCSHIDSFVAVYTFFC